MSENAAVHTDGNRKKRLSCESGVQQHHYTDTDKLGSMSPVDLIVWKLIKKNLMNCVMIKRSQDPLMTHYYTQDIFGVICLHAK